MHIFTNSTSGFPVLASGIFCASTQYRHSDFTALRQLNEAYPWKLGIKSGIFTKTCISLGLEILEPL